MVLLSLSIAAAATARQAQVSAPRGARGGTADRLACFSITRPPVRARAPRTGAVCAGARGHASAQFVPARAVTQARGAVRRGNPSRLTRGARWRVCLCASPPSPPPFVWFIDPAADRGGRANTPGLPRGQFSRPWLFSTAEARTINPSSSGGVPTRTRTMRTLSQPAGLPAAFGTTIQNRLYQDPWTRTRNFASSSGTTWALV